MEIDEWQRLARQRLQSAKMSDEEWESVTYALLMISESEGIEVFDEAIEKMHKANEERE